jgi:S-adenosylmethionine:tRNA ribosyltransferase-isomerase
VGSKLILDDGIEAMVVERAGGLYTLEFSTDILPFLQAHGEVPLPPYLSRAANTGDDERYQTIYARKPGAVAAPTAGLHFDTEMLEETRLNGVKHAWVTLHVGAGTFQSLRESRVEDNRLHRERVVVSEDCCRAVAATRAAGGRVVAIGTTAVRALECASSRGNLSPFDAETDLFILPGFKFRSVDAVLTNFHLPRSSLLMLVAAFAGRERILAAYHHAIRERYRFFSYGDAMFLTPGICA